MHCIDHLRKWKREGNFCGLGKQYATELDAWAALIDKICKNGAGIEEEFAVEHFTAGAARPLIRCKDDAVRSKALNYVISCLKRKETVTGGDLAATIRGLMGKPVISKPEPQTPVPSTPETLTIVKPPEGDAAPVPPSLGDSIRKQEMAAAEANQQKAAAEATAPAPAITLPPWSPEDCKTGHCPDKRNHTETTPRGKCCGLSGIPVVRVVKCPVIDRMQRADPRSQLAQAAAGTLFTTGTGAPSMQAPARINNKMPAPITFRPTPKQQEFLSRVMRIEGLHDLESAISEIVDRAMEAAD